MKKTLIGVLVLVGAGFAAQLSNQHKQDMGTKDAGGPDTYGYTYIDSREAGGPTFNWIDITSTGTEIQGLGDDGYVGPISVGFDFPFYWSTTDKVWLQFNGALSMSNPGGMYHPGQTSYIPSPQQPNDLVVFMGADLDFTAGGSAYYWTNNADTFILLVDNVPEWNDPSSYHTCEVILFLDANNNGHVLVQYGPQAGEFDNGGTEVHSAIGIENVLGNIGLQYLRDNNPSTNMPDSGLALLFVRPDSSSYAVTDVSLDMLWHEDHLGFFLHGWLDTAAVPVIRARNAGTEDISDFTATVTIKNDQGVVVYADTVTGPALSPGETTTVSFEPFNARNAGLGTYYLTGSVNTTGDMGPGNNEVSDVELRIVDNTTEWLSWDNDSSSLGYSWWIGGSGGDAGWGSRFTLPYDFHVDSVVAYAGSSLSGGGEVRVALLADNSGMPGDTIAISNNISIPNDSAVHTVSVAVGQDYTGGTTLHGAVFQMTDSTGCGIDATGPFSRNALEYTGTWAPSRDRETQDFYIRLYGSFTVNVNEAGSRPGAFVLRSLGPVPTKDRVDMVFVLPAAGEVSASLYNAAGQMVLHKSQSYEAGTGSMSLDLSQLSEGVYIYKLHYGQQNLTGKMVLSK